MSLESGQLPIIPHGPVWKSHSTRPLKKRYKLPLRTPSVAIWDLINTPRVMATAKIQDLLFIYRIRHNEFSGHLNDLFRERIEMAHNINTRSNWADYWIPTPRLNVTKMSFLYAAPLAWNNSSLDMRNISDINQFKWRLTRACMGAAAGQLVIFFCLALFGLFVLDGLPRL